MRFARWVLAGAGCYGVAVVTPQLFLEAKTGRDFPPAITHPEFYYGFVGVALAWQVAFLVMATDPARYRPLLWAAILEKLAFGVAAWALLAAGRVAPLVVVFGTLDLALAALFLAAWWSLRTAAPAPPSP